MLTAANIWHAAEAVVLTYGDSMLFLKCVTDRGGSEGTKHVHLASHAHSLIPPWSDMLESITRALGHEVKGKTDLVCA